jgi:orotidine-5'-phosphate decarboxylase
MTTETNFGDRLVEACAAKGGPVCVGLDPRWEDLPEAIRRSRGEDLDGRAAAILEFNRAVIRIVAPLVPVVKPNIAFYEALGAPGYRCFLETVAAAREAGLLVIGDVKRGDLGNTAESYARAHFEIAGCDAVTLNPYLGLDSIEPFLRRCRGSGRGVFLLVKTSNPGSADLQDLEVGNLRVFEEVAILVRAWAAGEGLVGARGWSAVGAVAGATHPAEVALLRRMLPGVPFLVPGYGAQGGTAKDCAAAFDAKGEGAVVNSSRGIVLPWRKGPLAEKHGEARWERAVEEAARETRDALRAVLPAGA